MVQLLRRTAAVAGGAFAPETISGAIRRFAA
jgi:hypothetical protein